jgi:hypothetical protein
MKGKRADFVIQDDPFDTEDNATTRLGFWSGIAISVSGAVLLAVGVIIYANL